MQELANTLIDNAAQCWTCPIFDRLFEIISNTAAAAYQRLTIISVIIFTVLLAFYILNAVWQNIKNGDEDPLFQKSVRPVLIKSLIALSLLTAGLIVPRLVSTIVFEPTAEITYQFSKTMLPVDYVVPEYTNAIDLGTDGFFTSDLRDTIIKILETSVSNFQVFIKIGVAIMDAAFSLHALLGIGALVRHIIVFFIGLYLTYYFGKWFIKYSFCFMDIIVAMAMFAFFFPLSLIFFIFKDASAAPGWMKKLGGDLGSGQIKKLVNAIVTIAGTILTYTIMALIIFGFLNDGGVDTNSIQNTAQSLFDFDLDNSTAMEITVAGAIVLVYVVNYIADQIPNVTKKIFEAFGVQQEDSISKEMGENIWQLTTIIANDAKNLAKAIINPESVTKKDDGKTEEGKTKEEK